MHEIFAVCLKIPKRIVLLNGLTNFYLLILLIVVEQGVPKN
jgi:hypothetical protein